MIEVLIQRPIVPGIDTGDDSQVARQARNFVTAMAAVGVGMQWIRTYMTEDSMFGVVAFKSEEDLKAFRLSAGNPASGLSVHRITRTVDPSVSGSTRTG